MNLHRHRHFFIDVEAFGPPGQGHPFALACVPFTLRGDIGEGKQWNFQGPSIKHGVWESAERSTLRWLLSQPEAVRSQVNGDMPFELAYAQFRDMVQGAARRRRSRRSPTSAAIADEHALASHVCHVPIMRAPDDARAHRPKSHVSELLGKRYARPPARYLLKIADQHRRCEAGPVEDDADGSEGRGSASRYRERRGDVLEPAQHFCRAAQGKLVPEGDVEARHEDSPGAV